MRLFGRNRRKTRNRELRELIDSHEQEAEEVQELARELIATINGDQDWLRKRLLKKGDKADGCSSNFIPDHNHHT